MTLSILVATFGLAIVPLCEARQVDEAELVGDYSLGGLGGHAFLRISKHHRFTFRGSYSCAGPLVQNEGSWEIKRGLLTLSPELESKHDYLGMLNLRFAQIVWGGKQYLIDEYQIPFFCSLLKTTDPPDSAQLFHYEKVEVPGSANRWDRPNLVPPEFTVFIGKPIECKVLEVRRDGTVKIDKGSESGLRAGIMLAGCEPRSGDIELLTVEKGSSTARPRYFFNSVKAVALGAAFSTSWTHGTGAIALDKLPAPH